MYRDVDKTTPILRTFTIDSSQRSQKDCKYKWAFNSCLACGVKHIHSLYILVLTC